MSAPQVVYLSGGVGGARLLDGLAQVLPPERLTVVVNTGDDFRHWGLWICPDLDTVMYTLAGIGDAERGWGLAGETFAALEMLERYDEPQWFGLGDRDLATHLVRSERLRRGERLTAITRDLCTALSIRCHVLPMADAPRATVIESEQGPLPFQRWFVQHRARPRVDGVRFEGPSSPTPEVLQALRRAELVVIGPSNPYVSIDPILTLDGVRDAVAAKRVIAVSPIVHGRAVKGPLASMIESLGAMPPSAAAIAQHYGALLHGLVIERGDGEILPRSLPRRETATVMVGREGRVRLAQATLAFAEELR